MSRDATPRLAQTERLLYLRTVEAFSELPAQYLAAIAEQTGERVFEAGEVIFKAGERCGRLFMIIDGQVAFERDGQQVATIGARSGLATLGVLSQRQAPITAVAREQTLALELEREPLLELLSDNFSMLRSILRLLARGLLRHRRQLGKHAGYDHRPDSGRECPASALDLVQRLEFLREAVPFARDHVAALVDLSRQAEEVRFDPGTVLWQQGDEAGWSDLIYCGRIRGEAAAPRVVGGEKEPKQQLFYLAEASAVGSIDNLAGLPRWYTATAETTVVSLRITADQLLDLFEDRFEIAHDFLKMISGELLELSQRLGTVPSGLPGSPRGISGLGIDVSDSPVRDALTAVSPGQEST